MKKALEEFGTKPDSHLYYLKVGDAYIDGQYGGQERYIIFTCHEPSRNVEYQKWSTSADCRVDRTDVVYAVATKDISEEMWTDNQGHL